MKGATVFGLGTAKEIVPFVGRQTTQALGEKGVIERISDAKPNIYDPSKTILFQNLHIHRIEISESSYLDLFLKTQN